jgi:rare lipoprotein A
MLPERDLRGTRVAGCLLAAGLLLAGCTGPRESVYGGDVDGAPARLPDVSRIPDAQPRSEPRSARGNPPFYEVMGRRYYVMKDAIGYRERGVASWYGTKFHGRLTSSGEPYDMYAMTAAHKTLPLPTYVRVTHRGNGRTVIVRVNDRGPFVGDRIIDLSYAAAIKLGMHEEGTALVDVEVVAPGEVVSRPVAADHLTSDPVVTPEPFWLQVGAFSDEHNAARLEAQLAGEGIHPVVTHAEQSARQRIYRVRVGPLNAVDEAERLLELVRQLGLVDAHLVR